MGWSVGSGKRRRAGIKLVWRTEPVWCRAGVIISISLLSWAYKQEPDERDKRSHRGVLLPACYKALIYSFFLPFSLSFFSLFGVYFSWSLQTKGQSMPHSILVSSPFSILPFFSATFGVVGVWEALSEVPGVQIMHQCSVFTSSLNSLLDPPPSFYCRSICIWKVSLVSQYSNSVFQPTHCSISTRNHIQLHLKSYFERPLILK